MRSHTYHRRFIDIDPDEPLTDDDLTFRELIEKELLKTLYHWQSLTIRRLRNGYDVTVRAATGFGKSLLFQAMMFSKEGGVVLVSVPTLGVMSEQVSSALCPG